MSTNHQSAIRYIRTLLEVAHGYLEGTVQGVSDAQAQWQLVAKVGAIDAQYVHIVVGEDFLVNVMAKGGAPLMATSHAGKTGFEGMPPVMEWNQWARTANIHMPTVRGYAQAVYAATDAYLDTVTDADLAKPVDLSALGMGLQTLGYLLALVILNAGVHTGEISCLKGLQGLTGYLEPSLEAAPAVAEPSMQ